MTGFRGWLKLWLHCLRPRNFGHCMCWVRRPGKPKRHFCSCGYLNDGVGWQGLLDALNGR